MIKCNAIWNEDPTDGQTASSLISFKREDILADEWGEYTLGCFIIIIVTLLVIGFLQFHIRSKFIWIHITAWNLLCYLSLFVDPMISYGIVYWNLIVHCLCLIYTFVNLIHTIIVKLFCTLGDHAYW